MGYKTKEIANITEPAVVSLGSNPNYMQFDSLSTTSNQFIDITLTVSRTDIIKENATLTFTDKATNTAYTFTSTRNGGEVSNTRFFLDNNKTITAENIRACMMKNIFLSNNFQITIPLVSDGGNLKNGDTIRITSKDTNTGAAFTIKLVTNAGFMQLGGNLENMVATEKEQKQRIELKVISNGIIDNSSYYANIIIKETDSKCIHTLKGTLLKVSTELIQELGIDTEQYYSLDKIDLSVAAQSIRYALSGIFFFKTYFNVTISPSDPNVVIIEAKNTGASNRFYFEYFDNSFIEVKNNVDIKDLITDYEIQLDVYQNTGVFLGEKDNMALGTYATTLSKAYFAPPLWFDVNTVAQKVYSDEFINAVGWCNPGTMTDHRFVAKRFDGHNTETFYISDVLYTVTGYERNLERNNLSAYVYDVATNNKVKPLTKQPTLTHIKGQTHYFNFMLADAEHSELPSGNDYKLGILYKLYSQSGNYLGTATAYEQSVKKFKIANTIRLNLDWATGKAENVGKVEAYLAMNGKVVSEALKFNILPACLHKVNDFAFLNSMGGWSTFNFGGMEQTDFKPEATTIHKTQTPDYKINSRIESVYNKEITEQFIAQTSPIKAEVAEWLKELSASIAVYELSTKRYIIVDDLNVKHNSKDDLFSLQMKYHYSDAYNAVLK